MHALLLASLLSLPIYPLNPVAEDTLALRNLHLALGVASPNNVMDAGPELSARFEFLVVHRFILRSAFDYRYGKVTTNLLPNGRLHSSTISIEALYYRGTDHLTGFFGWGLVYVFSNFRISGQAADSLRSNFGITGVRVKENVGYRLTLGLRYRKAYSFEIGITELKTAFVYTTALTESSYFEQAQRSRFSNIRATFGYIIPLDFL